MDQFKDRRRYEELKSLWSSGKLETAEQIGELCALEAKFESANAALIELMAESWDRWVKS